MLAVERELYRVGPNCETWPNNLTENPYQSLKVGPQFGPTLYNFRLDGSANGNELALVNDFRTDVVHYADHGRQVPPLAAPCRSSAVIASRPCTNGHVLTCTNRCTDGRRHVLPLLHRLVL
jgi:hypothetical protein